MRYLPRASTRRLRGMPRGFPVVRRVLPVEVKLGAVVGAREVAGLRSCMADLQLRRGIVIYTGWERRGMGGGVDLVPWSEVSRGDFDLPL